ncbi:MAG: FMN-binding negative transcriptional regulator [Chloroflexota bacterium]
MYQPAHFREDRLEILHTLIQAHPLGALVTHSANGLEANHVPVALHQNDTLGVLRCHLARANTQWRSIESGGDVLIIFQGPEAYISPSWYPTKAETGKVVPTWNYVVVHVHGTARTIHEPTWLYEHVSTLSDTNEAGFPAPWSVTDAPADFVDSLLKAIVGVEIQITRIEGKWKMSQNRAENDRQGVAGGLRNLTTDTALLTADLVAR